MAYRKQAPDSPWTTTLSYHFTDPCSKERISNPLKVALLFLTHKEIKSKKEILKLIGYSKEKYSLPGYLSGLFTALNWNEVVKYNRDSKTFQPGPRFQEYLEYTVDYIQKNNLQKAHRKEYQKILCKVSPSVHFIVA